MAPADPFLRAADEGLLDGDAEFPITKAMSETDDLLGDATGDDASLLSEVKDFLYGLADSLGTD